MKKVFVTGIAGTGKTALENVLKERGFNTMDVEQVPDLCSWVSNETGEKVLIPNPDNKFIDEHEYKCDISKLEKLLGEYDDHIFVFGSAGDNSDFIPLFDIVVLLQCEPQTLIHRLQSRDTSVFAKEEEVQNRMLGWKKQFDEIMLKTGAVPISTEADIETVADEVTKLLL